MNNLRYEETRFQAALKQVRTNTVATAIFALLLYGCSTVVIAVAIMDDASPMWSRRLTAVFAVVGFALAVLATVGVKVLAGTWSNLIAGRDVTFDPLDLKPEARTNVLSKLLPALGNVLRDRSSGLLVYSRVLKDQ